MPSQKGKLTPIQARMEKAGKRLEFKSDAEIEAWESHKQSRQMISNAVTEAKEHIGKQPQAHEQMMFSFMPTTMTRTTPFFPINKQEMKDRPYDDLEWETPWGQITISGKRLSIYDESLLLSILVLVKKYRSETFETSMSELCQISGVAVGKNTYQAIGGGIDRLTGTKIKLETIESKGKKRKLKMMMVNTILSGGTVNPETGKLQITVNSYFLQMYTESFITNMDLKFRNQLKGDITKALYRFYEGQRGDKYSCHILTLAKAVNLNIDLPIRKLRDRIRRAHRELKSKGFLTKAMISKNDIVSIWKSKKQVKNKYL